MSNRTSGATLLEVLFATVVIVIGLIGIATLIPFAARDAQQAINHNQAVSLGASWSDAFFARGLHRHNGTEYRWVWFRDYVNDGTNPSWEFYELNGYASSLPQVRLRINGDTVLAFESSSFSGASVPSRRIWGRMPICIDPMFFASPSTLQRVNDHQLSNATPFSRPEWFRASVFPYFEDHYDPAVDPLDSSGGALFSDQPRMLRVGLASTASTSVMPIPESLASSLFSSTDDFIDNSFIDPNDITDPRNSRPDPKVLPPERLFAKFTNSSSPSRALFTKRYTWMATITPEEPKPGDLITSQAESYAHSAAPNAKVTFLIMHQHDSSFVSQAYSPGSSEDKPKGERLVRVYPISGNFVGGAGGRVRLVGNSNTSSVVQAGDWIMLARYYIQDGSPPPVGNPPPPFNRPRLYPFFRWYRIIGVDADTIEGPLSAVRPNVGVDQYASANTANDGQIVWARDVSLEGLDFKFGEFPPGNTAVPYQWWPTIPTPTTGTLVSGVVTVFHSEMKLN